MDITTPITEEVAAKLQVGDTVSISGYILCGRDAVLPKVLKMIEDAFINKEISPLGIVWLCNGCNRYINHYWRIEDRFLTDRIIENVSMQLYEPQTSEDARNIMYLLEKILV